jgi:class 3 adenylate cyclase
MQSTADWLKALGLDKYVELFAAQEIDFDLLPELTDQDLEKLGIPLGPRKRLLKAIAALSDAEAPALASTGEAIRVTPAPAAAATTEGERRQATVLFSDLSGYTAMNERLDPELVAELVGRIKADAVSIVEMHGGIVNQFVGDEIIALFGIPIAHEDDPVGMTWWTEEAAKLRIELGSA